MIKKKWLSKPNLPMFDYKFLMNKGYVGDVVARSHNDAFDIMQSLQILKSLNLEMKR